MVNKEPNQDKQNNSAKRQAGGDQPKKSGPEHDAKGRITNTKLTEGDAADMVRRMVPKRDKDGQIVKDKEGNPVSVPEKISANEVMSFAEYDDKVVVVTKSGEKLEGPKEF